MPTGLHHDHRLDSRCCPESTHECAGILYAFDVHEDAVGLGIRHEEVEDLAEVDVG